VNPFKNLIAVLIGRMARRISLRISRESHGDSNSTALILKIRYTILELGQQLIKKVLVCQKQQYPHKDLNSVISKSILSAKKRW